MNIDLRTCKPGQKLRLRNGEMAIYLESTCRHPYPHNIEYTHNNYVGTRTDDGKMFCVFHGHFLDVIEILPFKDTNQINNMNDKEKARQAYITLQELSGLKVGDKVKVTRKAKSYEMGWDNAWTHSMDGAIGNTYIIRSFNGSGVYMGDYYSFPFFVLEKVAPEFVEVKLNESHTAKVYKDKIVVGCQTFPIDIIEKLTAGRDEIVKIS